MFRHVDNTNVLSWCLSNNNESFIFRENKSKGVSYLHLLRAIFSLTTCILKYHCRNKLCHSDSDTPCSNFFFPHSEDQLWLCSLEISYSIWLMQNALFHWQTSTIKCLTYTKAKTSWCAFFAILWFTRAFSEEDHDLDTFFWIKKCVCITIWKSDF